MSFKYKKGLVSKNGIHGFCFAISSGKLEFYHGGLAKVVNETDDIAQFTDFCKSENATSVVLIDLLQHDFDFVVQQLCDIVQEIELHYSFGFKSVINHDNLSKCKNLKSVLIDCCKGEVNLWNVGDNKLLESLEITGVEKLYNQQGLKNASVSKLVIKNRNFSLSDTNKPVIQDFSLFESMPNLKVLDLFVGKKSSKKDDLTALSGLKNIQTITLNP